MSRIYQGGGADRRYQSSARGRNYNPAQATSNAKAIRQEGERILQDLETARREQERQDQMSNLETSFSDRTAQLNLQVEQTAEAGQFKLDQLYEQSVLQADQLTERQRLQTQQAYDKASFQLSQLGDSQALKRQQFYEKQELEKKDREERFDLGVEARAQSAQFAVDRAELSANQSVDRANTQLIQTAISSLISFAGDYVQAAVQYNQEQKAKEAELADDWWLDGPGAAVGSDGTPNPVAQQQRNQHEIEQAEEAGFQQVANNNSIEAERIRAPMADATMDRNLRQVSVQEAALTFDAEFQKRVSDPNTVIEVNGRAVTFATLTDETLTGYLKGIATQITSEFGVTRADAHAAVMQYGRQVKGSFANIHRQLGSKLRAAAKQERYDAGLQNAEALTYGNDSDYQTAWEVARNAYITSGEAMGLSPKQINDAVLEDLLPRVNDPEKLGNVLKTGQKGTEFIKQAEYREMIQKEVTRRLQIDNNSYGQQQTFVNNQIKEVMNDAAMQLAGTEDPQESFQIRQNAIAQLGKLGPLAHDEIAKLTLDGRTNNNVFLGFVEAFESGNPPSTADILEGELTGALSTEQKATLMQMGMRADQVNRAISSAGLPTVDKQLTSAVGLALAAAGVQQGERKGLAAGIVANLKPNVERELRQYVMSNPDATPQMIQEAAAKVMKNAQLEVWDSVNQTGRLKRFVGDDPESGQYFYDYDTSQPAPIHTRTNPITGEYQRVYANHKVDDIPARGTSLNDVLFDKATFLKALEVWNAGGQDYSVRVNQLATKFNTTPAQLVKRQAYALGFPSIEEVPQYLMKVNVVPEDMKSGFNALQSMGFPARGAAYLAGNIMQESSWDGQRTWGEVKNDGSDRNGGLVSWMDGVAHNNFRLTKIENYLGKPIAQASTAEQLQAMKWEMQRDYKDAFRIFMNSNATDTQLRRASFMYWGYGDVGDRYKYAESLL